jgi:hypothetical protein
MNTIDFIRKHTRIILETGKDEDEDEKVKKEYSPHYGGKYSKSVRIGRISKASQQALGLAAKNPSQLLLNLGLQKYETEGSSRFEEIINFIEEIRKRNNLISLVYESPEKESNHIDIPVFLLSGKVPAVKESQCPRYIKAMLLAGHALGIIDFDIEKNHVGLREIVNDEEIDDEKENEAKSYFVRLTIKD